MGSERRKFSLFMAIQTALLICLVLVGIMIFHESKILRKSVRILQKASEINGYDDHDGLDKIDTKVQQKKSGALTDEENQVEEPILKDKRPTKPLSKPPEYFSKANAKPEEHSNQQETKQQMNNTKRKRASGVIIFTTMRAGSSFVGELFNRHRQVFYVFEPLHPFGSRNSQAKQRARAISDVMSCDFEHLATLYQDAQKSGTMVVDYAARCAIDNFCFKSKTEYLRRNTSLCTKNKCKVPFKPAELSRLCRDSLLPITKIIVELELNKLQQIIDSDEHDIRVIHLERDPRAVLASRREVFAKYNSSKPYSVTMQSKYLCSHSEKNLHFADCFNNSEENCQGYKGLEKWRNKYLLLRYEDASLDPLGTAHRIYDFIGIDFDPKIRDWIEENTKLKTNGPPSMFGTGRNSLDVMGRWRNTLSLDEITAIQKNCLNVMQRLEYKLITNETQLHDSSLS